MTEPMFIDYDSVEREAADGYMTAWHSRPSTTGAEQLVVIEVSFEAGSGHDFHRHPAQEEVIYVIDGVVEQWLDTKKRTLTAGDSAFIPAGVVHATFNMASGPSKFIAILSPCIGDAGYELEPMHSNLPWKNLRP